MLFGRFQNLGVLQIIQEKASAEIRGDFFPNEFPGEFCRGFFAVDFVWALLLGKKTGGKNPRQNSNQNLGVSHAGICPWQIWGLRDRGWSKAEDTWGCEPFSCVFWISQVLFGPSGKGRKRQKRAKKAENPARAARHSFNLHLLHTLFVAAQYVWVALLEIRMQRLCL